MSLKTDGDYNEFDYIEENGQIRELTVTIALSEYRTLVCEVTKADETICHYQEENQRLLKENENYKKFIFAKFPEIKNKVIEIIECLRKDFASSIQSEVQNNEN